MFAKIESWLTLGNQYVAASFVYLGLAVLLGGSTLLDSSRALATDNTPKCQLVEIVDEAGNREWILYDYCNEGYKCCGMQCLPEDDYTCCDE